MKKTIAIAALLATVTIAQAQTTATNWTASDCNSASHTLFNELNNGKVIVFAWVMPCVTCVNPSKTAYNVVQSYATSNPGKVLFYLADDVGDATCSSLSGWVNTNNIGNTNNMTIFDNSGNVINENDYGGTGMPHIVVMGGANHTIYFNQINAAANDATGLQNAINAAIGATGIKDVTNQINFSVVPNPVSDMFTVNANQPVQKVSVLSLNGQLIKEQSYAVAVSKPSIDISGMAPAIYMVKIVDKEGKTGIQKIVKQ